MQTNFSIAALAKPPMSESESILRACVHCGFCTATCPTYLLLGDELDSPRGRIYLIKDMLENERVPSAPVVAHIDHCLSCNSCMTTCPSGVDYMHLIDHARSYIEQTHQRPMLDRATRRALASILTSPRRLRASLLAASLARPFKRLIARLPGGKRLEAMLALSAVRRPPSSSPRSGTFAAHGVRRGRVALLSGCAQSVLGAHINEAAIRLLTRHGVEVVVPQDEACCGALVQHLGQEERALAAARHNVDVWMRVNEADGLDAIVITTSGCGTTIKDYGHMLRMDAAYANKAARVAGLAKDVSEYLDELGILPAVRETGQRVAYHSACSLQHGQKLRDQPRRLLRSLGFLVQDVPEGHICCGSAGVYNVLQPEIAQRLRDRKIENIEKVKPWAIVAGNLGCITQISSGTAMPMVHLVELIDWATGGPLPAALEGRQWTVGVEAAV